ncbi:hypothetical protein MN608_06991 [Microdochium nivale]|nr:hypothetical protein MN608_06991 [Microdochium nivale]
MMGSEATSLFSPVPPGRDKLGMPSSLGARISRRLDAQYAVRGWSGTGTFAEVPRLIGLGEEKKAPLSPHPAASFTTE